MYKRLNVVVVFCLCLTLITPFPASAGLPTGPTRTDAIRAYAPPTPPPEATPTPVPPIEPGASPDPSKLLSPELEQARAQQAIEAVLEKYLHYWGPRYQTAPIEVKVEGEWAYGVARWQSETKTLAGPIHILARRLPDGTWLALMPSADGLYPQWVDAVPESLVPAGEKGQLRTQATEADALQKPMATPAVPLATTLTPASKEEPTERVEPVPGLAQPTATPTPQATPAVPLVATVMPPGKERLGGPVPGPVQLTATPTPQAMASFVFNDEWLLYEDTNFGFAVRYPPNWFLYPTKRLDDGGVATIANRPLNDFVSKVITTSSADFAKVEIGVFLHDKSPTQSLKEWVKPADWVSSLLVQEDETLLNGIGAIQQIYLCGESFNSTTYIPRETKVYFISVTSSFPTLSDELLMILNSFTFTAPYSKPQNIVDHLYSIDTISKDSEDISVAAPSGFRLPFDGNYAISNGPGEGAHATGGRAGEAIDFVMGPGTVVRATESGNIIFRDWQGCYGKLIGIQHDNGMSSWYAHLDNITLVSDNQRVSRGDVIALSGNTGYGSGCPSTGAHLHFHVRSGETPVCMRDWPGVWWNTSFPPPPGGSGLYSGCACYPPCSSAPSQCRSGARTLSCGNDTDTTPPDGDITSPSENATITNSTVHLAGWASDSQSGFNRAHFTAYYNGSWRQVGSDFTSSPFGFDWDMCSDGVPDGPVTIGLDIWDNAGNEANSPRGVRHFTKNYGCPPVHGDWEARYDQGSTCWWDTNCNMNPRCTEAIDGPKLHKDWGSGAPCGGMNGDDWVGDFHATLNFPAGEYVFYLDHDDGVKLWLNGQNIADLGGSGNNDRVCNGQTGYPLNGNADLRVLLREEGGEAKVHLTWSTDTSVCNPPPVPPTPQSPGNGSTFSEGESITLCWSDTGNEYYGEVWGGPAGTTYFGWQSGTCRNIGSQWAGYTYSWHVRARNSAGTSGWSNTWTFTVKPAAPSYLSATAPSYSQVNLTWNDNSGNEEGYRIYRNGSSVGQVGANVTSYQDTGLSPNTSYSYYVRAYRGSIESDSSNTVNITTPPCSVPVPPVLVSPPNGATLPNDADITLDWNSSTNASGYRVHLWGDNSPDINSVWLGAIEWYIGQLDPDTYHWQVRARNQCGESNWSSTWSFTVTAQVTVGPLLYDSYTVDDDTNGESSGDGDGVVECGENIELYVTLRNHGDGTAAGVNATISTSDPYVTWLYNTDSAYPDIPGAGTGTNSNDFDFAVASGTPDGHVIQFNLNISASNGGPWSDSFSLPVTCSQPDLRPYAPSGYSYPVVPSSVQGTHTVNTLYAGQPTYFDWHFINSGSATASGNFYVELWVDSTRYVRYPYSNFSAGWSGGFDDWSEVVTTPGWHTVRLITDPDNTVAESNETNNAWEHQFYWIPSAPYSDNMESGTNNWTATGLWHQVSSSSPYPAYRSPTHSWWYGQDSTGNYNTGAANSGDLTSPSIYIPTSGYYLRFWYRYETETQVRDWDQRWVQISVDGGPFDNVLQLSDDPMNYWLQSQAIELPGYAGHVIKVRFHFNTIDGMFNDYRGWYIDDFSISTAPPPPCADTHEPNNTTAQATAIAYGQTLDADICPGGDYDFYRFTGAEDDKIVVDIDAKVNGSSLDSYVFLMDSYGNVLAEHDDEIPYELQDSHLGYQLPHDGTYYIKVRAWNHPSVGGTGYFYTIHLLTDNTNPSSAAITSPGNNAWLDPNLVTITASATDNESGIRRVEFLWHSADWDNSDWVWLGADEDSRDGWSWDFDTSGLAEQRGGAFYIWAFDWAGNWTGAGVWNLGIDRTPPTITASIRQMYDDAPFRDFYVYWWDSYDNLSGIASYDVQYRDGDSGTWTNLLTGTTNTYYRFVGQNGHTYYFRVRARDRAGNLSNYAGGNGDVQHTVQICSTPTDDYEADNTYTSAKWIYAGDLQVHNIHTEGDQDWVKFQATAGFTYTLATTNDGGHADTVLYLYGTDGTTLITSNDDYPGKWPSSQISWQAPAGGVYYVKVDHWDPYAYGCTTVYGLSMTEEGQSPTQSKVFLPLVLREYSGHSTVTWLTFKVRFQGRTAGTGERAHDIPIQVVIKNSNGSETLFEKADISVTPAGGSSDWGTASVNVSAAHLVPGQTYQVFVKGKMHLSKRVTLALLDNMTIDYTDPAINADGVLLAGDVNGDDVINGSDSSMVMRNYGAGVSNDPNSETYRCDINGDEAINSVDVSYVNTNSGKTGNL